MGISGESILHFNRILIASEYTLSARRVWLLSWVVALCDLENLTLTNQIALFLTALL